MCYQIFVRHKRRFWVLLLLQNEHGNISWTILIGKYILNYSNSSKYHIFSNKKADFYVELLWYQYCQLLKMWPIQIKCWLLVLHSSTIQAALFICVVNLQNSYELRVAFKYASVFTPTTHLFSDLILFKQNSIFKIHLN